MTYNEFDQLKQKRADEEQERKRQAEVSRRASKAAQAKYEAEAPIREAKERAEEQQRGQLRRAEAQKIEQIRHNANEKLKKGNSIISVTIGAITGAMIGITVLYMLPITIIAGAVIGLYVGKGINSLMPLSKSTKGDFTSGAISGATVAFIIAAFIVFVIGDKSNSFMNSSLFLKFMSAMSTGLLNAVVFGVVGGVLGVIVGSFSSIFLPKSTT